jgi:asparagine synthetase B (glutamine-hydrolysing)
MRRNVSSQAMSLMRGIHNYTLSVGLEGSPAAAQIVADHIGTIHHEIKFTIQEGLDAIRDVIYNLETYDVTTISFNAHVVDGESY